MIFIYGTPHRKARKRSIFMSLQEFYTNINGDYEDIINRLQKEATVIRFVKRFTSDGTYGELAAAVEGGDISASYEAAHKFKGLVANLAFTDLYFAVSELAEQLRPMKEKADTLLMQRVSECYRTVLEQAKRLIADDQ